MAEYKNFTTLCETLNLK